jgi:hypothetical protein
MSSIFGKLAHTKKEKGSTWSEQLSPRGSKGKKDKRDKKGGKGKAPASSEEFVLSGPTNAQHLGTSPLRTTSTCLFILFIFVYLFI